ncbi:MAG: hypothetical protein OEO20_15455 [Gemmatimonadota bacterium]|nr:hypothetical protein [Gemmatimonadota bacterium]MDH3368782.1 hypothetical protein [Gemmatimonadota bacterium]MDH3479692.1 hypothetical protein [Gemmatimonadota bacterium]MDH3570788.1 hypothetical protein [Gemmatimonadota bacterium]MDH5549820.1 hypothetical protein [Gemmatimonadota bacterium]
MARTTVEAFAELHERLGPGPKDLMSGDVDASLIEAFKDVRTAAHPDRIAAVSRSDYIGRGMLAHALFLDWRDRHEVDFLLDQVRQHMMTQLRDDATPHPDVYRLAEALTRLATAWKRVEGGGG